MTKQTVVDKELFNQFRSSLELARTACSDAARDGQDKQVAESLKKLHDTVQRAFDLLEVMGMLQEPKEQSFEEKAVERMRALMDAADKKMEELQGQPPAQTPPEGAMDIADSDSSDQDSDSAAAAAAKNAKEGGRESGGMVQNDGLETMTGCSEDYEDVVKWGAQGVYDRIPAFFEEHESADLTTEVSRAKTHPWFEAHLKALRLELGEDEFSDFDFGSGFLGSI